jgi:membrane fusion protein (multidrug efflux system)
MKYSPMLKINLFSLILAILLLSSCGDGKEIDSSKITFDNVLKSKNLDSIRAKKDELNAKQQEITSQLKAINARITTLDENSNLPLISTLTSKLEPFIHYIELQEMLRQKVWLRYERSSMGFCHKST